MLLLVLRTRSIESIERRRVSFIELKEKGGYTRGIYYRAGLDSEDKRILRSQFKSLSHILSDNGEVIDLTRLRCPF